MGLLAWYSPDAVGGGYHLLHESTFMEGGALALAALFLVRLEMTILCYGTGAPGGIIAPMLTLGMLVGLALSRFSAYLPDLGHPGVLAVAGTVAFLAATVRAPLTGLLLAVEMTAEYQLMMPAALTAMTATAAAEWLGGRPIYSVLLDRVASVAGLAGRGVVGRCSEMKSSRRPEEGTGLARGSCSPARVVPCRP